MSSTASDAAIAPETPAIARLLTVARYGPEHKAAWDRLVASGKNSTFLFFRDYMEYHSDRFVDHSLVIFDGVELVGLLPANLGEDHVLHSHQGLTYGGFVVKSGSSLGDVLDVVRSSLVYLESCGIRLLRYKRIPRFFNLLPDDEIDYAMYILDSTLYRRDCALVIPMANPMAVRKGKKHAASRARKAGCEVAESRDFDSYWRVALGPRLEERYGVTPVHTVDEIKLLASRFPNQIRLFTATLAGRIQAGVVIYETPSVAHLQYSAIAPDAVDAGALDFLTCWLIKERYADKRYFDFGICNEEFGLALNHSLLQSKEAFGARTCAHDFYEIRVDAHPKISRVLTSSRPNR